MVLFSCNAIEDFGRTSHKWIKRVILVVYIKYVQNVTTNMFEYKMPTNINIFILEQQMWFIKTTGKGNLGVQKDCRTFWYNKFWLSFRQHTIHFFDTQTVSQRHNIMYLCIKYNIYVTIQLSGGLFTYKQAHINIHDVRTQTEREIYHEYNI